VVSSTSHEVGNGPAVSGLTASAKEFNMSRNRKSRLVALSLASVAAVALPLGLAAPAHASTTKDGCTVTPLAPEFRGTYTSANVPYVYYPVEVSCTASASGLSVELNLQTWEQDLAGRAGDVDANGIDNADEDRIGSGSATRSFVAAGGTKTVDFLGVLPHTDTDFNEEVYDKVQFRVTSGPVVGKWSAFEFSPVTQIGW
jgi:hypothetical protein